MIDGRYKIFAVNPGSTSTKIAMFYDDEPKFITTVEHKPEELGPVQEQLMYRKQCILDVVKEKGYDLENVDVFVGRGGSMYPIEGGIYHINEAILKDARYGPFGEHPARLSSQLVNEFMGEYGGKGCIVDPPDTDEFKDVSRITGIKDVYNESRIHTLNQKAVARLYAAEHGTRYDKLDLVIGHIGGGVSVTAHEHGRMIDSNDILHGSGPITPTRCGDVSPGQLIELCFSGKYTKKELENLTHKNGGLLSLVGTADVREVEKMISEGNEYAKLCLDGMIYSIAKCIGKCAVALKGHVDQILLTGGVVHDKYVVEKIKEYTEWIAPVTAVPGEFEMEALGAGALRWIKGEEESKEYSGEPVWKMQY